MKSVLKKRSFRKVTSFVMAFALVVSAFVIVPKATKAEIGDNGRDYVSILSCSDYQKWYPNGQYNQDDWEFLKPQLQEICDAAWDAEVDPEYWLFGGDFSCLHNTSTSEEGMKQVKDIIYGTWPALNEDNSVIIQGNHDEADVRGMNKTGPVEFDDFIVYVINEDDYPTTQGSASVLPLIEKTSDDLYNYLCGLADNEEHRPVFILSHGGLHYDIDRQDGNNQYAYILYEAIRDIADELDIIFMFAHNHTNGDEMVGGSITFFPPGSEIGICHEDSISNKSGTLSEINFTYMNYGYIGYIGDINNNADKSPFAKEDLTNLLTVSEIKIYKDKITVERFSKNGHEEKFDSEVERIHRAPDPTPTPEPTPVPEQPKQDQGQTVQPPVNNVQTPVQNPDAGNASNANDSKESKVAKVSGLKVKKSGKAAVVSWKKASGASKYEVLCATAKNFKKGVKKVTSSKTKATVKKLKKGTTYFFKVRGISGSVKGAYSAVKKIKH